MVNTRGNSRLFYLSEKEIRKAASKVKQGKKVRGKPQRDLRIDAVSKYNALGEFFENKPITEKNLTALIQDVQSSKYSIKPYTAIALPRKGKAPRPILSPSPRDRIIFTAILNRIRPRFKFLKRDFNIFGSDRHEKLRTIREILLEIIRLKKKHRYILKVDIKDFFPSINKEILLAELRQLVKDDFVLHIIQHSLYNKLNYVGDAKDVKDRFVKPNSKIGIPQGCAYSPLLANFYGRHLDIWLKDNNHTSFRYLDDLLVFVKDAQQAERVFNNLKRIGRGLNLEFHKLNESGNKTYSCPSRTSFEYLGINITEQGLIIPEEKIKKFLSTFKERLFNLDTLKKQGADKVFEYTRYFVNGWRIYYSSTCVEDYPRVREHINKQILLYLHKKEYARFIVGQKISSLTL